VKIKPFRGYFRAFETVCIVLLFNNRITNITTTWHNTKRSCRSTSRFFACLCLSDCAFQKKDRQPAVYGLFVLSSSSDCRFGRRRSRKLFSATNCCSSNNSWIMDMLKFNNNARRSRASQERGAAKVKLKWQRRAKMLDRSSSAS